jgi:hypothetical protein
MSTEEPKYPLGLSIQGYQKIMENLAAGENQCKVTGKPVLYLRKEDLEYLRIQEDLQRVLKMYAVHTTIDGYEYLKGIGLG